MQRSFLIVGALALALSCSSDGSPGDTPDAVLKRSAALCKLSCDHIADKCGVKKTDCLAECAEGFQDERARCLSAREALWECMAAAPLMCSATPVRSADCQSEETFLAACRSSEGSTDRPADAGRTPSNTDAGLPPKVDAGQSSSASDAGRTPVIADAGRAPTADAGRPTINLTPSQCSTSSSDSTCDACSKRKCCAEQTAYDGPGATFASCVRNCGRTVGASSGAPSSPVGSEPGLMPVGASPFNTIPSNSQSCNEQCRSRGQAGFDAFEKLRGCRAAQCRSECAPQSL